MARYTGPKTKIARRFGEAIFGEDKVLAKKNYPPGQHGVNKRRKLSEYGTQLREKQKAKYTYGVLERQFRNLFEKASRMKGVKGEVLLQLLEARLDNVVYRLGIAPTRAAARQLVLHRHITVNGKVYVVDVADGKAAPAAAASSGKAEDLISPLPGTILKIVAPAGTVVAEGDTILILEAMKQETEIKAEKGGTVVKVMVEVGNVVAQGDALASIE